LETITVEDLQDNIDEVFDRVEDGEGFIITIDGIEKAVLIPYTDYEELIREKE
jgi:prevent-host-death family protein